MPRRISHPIDVPVFTSVGSEYYGCATRPTSARTRENERLLERIRHLRTDHDGVMVSPRVWEELRYAGERCGRHRVARFMRHAGLQGIPQRRRWRTKPSGMPPVGTRNHLERDFTAPASNTKWVTDITYIPPPSTGCISASCWICIPAGR